MDTSQAAQTGTWTRVRVVYDNGLTVVANDEAGVLLAGSSRLPQFGWVAQGAGVTAWTALVEGQVADYARTDDSTFANARPASDWNQNGIHRIQQDLNPAANVLDFGDVRTSGSILVRREGGEWVLRALPRAGDFMVELGGERFGQPASVRCVGGSAPTELPETEGDWWRLKLNGAREYHWK